MAIGRATVERREWAPGADARDEGETTREDEGADATERGLITNQAMRSKGWRSFAPTATPRAATSSRRGSFLPARKNARRLRAYEPRSNGLENEPSADLR